MENPDVAKEDLNKLKELFAKFQVEPVALLLGNPYALSDIPFEPSLISPDEEGRKKSLNFINATLEVANYLSIPLLTFTSGFLGRDFTTTTRAAWCSKLPKHCMFSDLGKERRSLLQRPSQME